MKRIGALLLACTMLLSGFGAQAKAIAMESISASTYLNAAEVSGTADSEAFITFTVFPKAGDTSVPSDVAQQTVYAGREFKQTVAINPDNFNTGEYYVLVRGKGIREQRLDFKLLGGDSAAEIRMLLSAAADAEEMSKILSGFSAYIGKYKDYLGTEGYMSGFYAAYKKNYNDSLADRETLYVEFLKQCFESASEEYEMLKAVNAASASGVWGTLKSVIIDTYADMLGIDVDDYSNLDKPNRLFELMLGKVYNNTDEVRNAYIDAYYEVYNAVPEVGKDKTRGDSTVKITDIADKSNENATDKSIPAEFDDIGDFGWAAEAIKYLLGKGAIVGDGSGKYYPRNSITREEFIKIFVCAVGKKPREQYPKASFTDVSEQDWCYPYVECAAENRLISGYSDGSFGKGQLITRAEMATIIYRYINERIDNAERRPAVVFEDFWQIPEFAKEAVSELYQYGIINGNTENRFNPMENATRAEAAVMIYYGAVLADNEEATAEKAEAEFDEALEFVYHMEFISGSDYENYAPDKKITGGKLAQLIYRFCSAKGTINEAKEIPDVKPGDDGYEAVTAAVGSGLMSLNENGWFAPDRYVEFDEACEIFSKIAGYNVMSGYKSWYAIADYAGILDKVSGRESITYKDAYRMMFNVLHGAYFVQTGFDSAGGIFSKGEETVLEHYFDILWDEGIVEGINNSSLYAPDQRYSDGHIGINGKNYSSDIADGALGFNVRYYYNDNEEKLYWMYELDSNEVMKIAAENLENFSGDSLYYKESANKRTKSINIQKNIAVIYNGIAYPEYKQAELLPEIGSVLLLDNNGDGKYDVMHVEAIFVMYVDKVDTVNDIIYDKYNSELRIGGLGEDCEFNIISDGRRVSPESLAGKAIMVWESKNVQGTKFYTIKKLTTRVKGTVNAVSDDELLIDGRVYAVPDTLYTDYEISVGKAVEAYLIGNMAVMIINDEASSSERFGYFIRPYNDADENKIYAKIADKSGINTIAVSNKVLVDGVKKDNYDDFAASLLASAQMSNSVSEYEYSQIIRYIVDSSGEIKSIDTLVYNPGSESEDSLQRTYTGTAVYAVQNKALYTEYSDSRQLLGVITDDTEMAIIPSRDRANEKEYYFNQNRLSDKSGYAVELYNVGKYKDIGLMAVYQPKLSSIPGSTWAYIVTRVTETVNDDNEVVTEISYMDGTEKTATLSADAIGVGGGDAPTVRKGDLIRMRWDKNGEISVLQKVFDGRRIPAYSDRELVAEKDEIKFNAGFRIIYGTALNISVSKDIITFTKSIPDDSEGFSAENEELYRIGSANVYIFDSAANSIESGSIADILEYSREGTPDRLAVMSASGVLKQIFIFR